MYANGGVYYPVLFIKLSAVSDRKLPLFVPLEMIKRDFGET